MARRLRWWLAAFLSVAMVAVWCFHAPIVPIVVAGVLTLLVTLRSGRNSG